MTIRPIGEINRMPQALFDWWNMRVILARPEGLLGLRPRPFGAIVGIFDADDVLRGSRRLSNRPD